MKKVKEVWNSLKGSKRNIGIIALWILKATTTFFPDFIPANSESIIREGIDIILIGGTFDALRRTDKGQEIINNSIDKGTEIKDKALSIIKIK